MNASVTLNHASDKDRRDRKIMFRAAVTAAVILVAYLIAGIVGGVMTLADVKATHQRAIVDREKGHSRSVAPHAGDGAVFAIHWHAARGGANGK